MSWSCCWCFGLKDILVLCRYEVAPRSDSEDSGSEEEEEEEEVQNTVISTLKQKWSLVNSCKTDPPFFVRRKKRSSLSPLRLRQRRRRRSLTLTVKTYLKWMSSTSSSKMETLSFVGNKWVMQRQLKCACYLMFSFRTIVVFIAAFHPPIKSYCLLPFPFFLQTRQAGCRWWVQ